MQHHIRILHTLHVLHLQKGGHADIHGTHGITKQTTNGLRMADVDPTSTWELLPQSLVPAKGKVEDTVAHSHTFSMSSLAQKDAHKHDQ